MSIGILYESIEWSNQHLSDILNKMSIKTELINLETEPISWQRILQHQLIINRLFPSAPLRGNKRALRIADTILKVIQDHHLPIINSQEAYRYDCSKLCCMQALQQKNIPVPESLAYFSSADLLTPNTLSYPNVLKPDCSGRSFFTYILNNREDLKVSLKQIPDQPFIIQEYIKPVKKFTTRIEIVGQNIMSIHKRYLGSGGLSSYHAGSAFKKYPNCSVKIIQTAFKALALLNIEMGSVDIIESSDDEFYLIDINATSNFSEDNVEMLGFDPLQVMAEYILKRYSLLTKTYHY